MPFWQAFPVICETVKKKKKKQKQIKKQWQSQILAWNVREMYIPYIFFRL